MAFAISSICLKPGIEKTNQEHSITMNCCLPLKTRTKGFPKLQKKFKTQAFRNPNPAAPEKYEPLS